MIKLDKDVHGALKALEKAGFESYITGDCIIESLTGESPWEWDLVTKADAGAIQKIFPAAELVHAESSTYRLDFTYEEEDEAGELVEKGSVCDVIPFTGTIEEELSGYGFTACAIADNPERPLADPYGGVQDVQNRILKPVQDGKSLFREEPIRMMEAMSYVALYGFDLSKDLAEAIVANWRLLLDIPMAPIRQELERIMTGTNTGKALNMMADTGLMAVVFGENVARKMSTGEGQQFMALCENIDQTRPVRLRRLALLYTILNEKRGMEAIERMNFDLATETRLKEALTELVTVTFLNNTQDLKRYIFENGWDKYNFLHNLTKAQRIVYEHPSTRIEARNELLKLIQQNNEPIFPEDLCIDEDDILEEGITQDRERATELLKLVVAKVHQDARNNDRKYLLKMARKYNKGNISGKLSAKSRYVHWLK